MTRLSPLLVLVLVACSAPQIGGFDDAAGAPDLQDTGDVDADPDAALPSDRFVIAATSGSYDVAFTIAIDGAGTERYGAVAVAAGAGTLEIDGEPRALAVYERQDWTDFGYTLYQALAVSDDEIHIVWFYCMGSALTDLWVEPVDGTPLETVPASGTCTGSAAVSTVSVAFAPLNMAIPPLLDGFTVTGPSIELGGGTPGSLTLEGSTLQLYPFGHVDCTVDCGSPGWHELHAMLWDAQREWLCFAIFYLFLDDRPPLLAYAFSLPVLTAPFGTVELPDATWSIP